MPMYNQFPAVGDEPTVTMSNYAPRDTSMYCPVPMISEVLPKPMYGTQFAENYQNTFENVIRMLKDPRYRKQSEAFLRVFAPRPCEPQEDSVYDKLQFNLDENPRWKVPPKGHNHNTEENSNDVYAAVYSDQFINTLYTQCNNYYGSLSEDDAVSEDKMDVSDKEMYDKFDDEAGPEEDMFSYPQEPSRMPPGFTKKHAG